jgi:hypothetical protein
VSALEERRQRAREAFDDQNSGAADMFGTATPADRLVQARESSIETATRVRIDGLATRAAMAAYAESTGYDMPSAQGMDAALAAAFRAAGFEVEP